MHAQDTGVNLIDMVCGLFDPTNDSVGLGYSVDIMLPKYPVLRSYSEPSFRDLISLCERPPATQQPVLFISLRACSLGLTVLKDLWMKAVRSHGLAREKT